MSWRETDGRLRVMVMADGNGRFLFFFFLFFVFFFQAEDGIRDTSVTGVQTCALPIFREAAVVAISGLSR